MIEKIKKIRNNYVYQKGYKKAKEDAKKEIAELEEEHRNIVKNLIYEHDTAIMEKEIDNKLLRDQIKKSAKRDKETEELRLILKREKRIIDKFILNMRDKIDEFTIKGLRPFQEMNTLLDDIDGRKCKQIEDKQK